MKRFLPFILFVSTIASAQLQRYDNFAATTASASGIGNITQVIAGSTITVFNQPAVGVSCAGGGCVAASTFTSRTGGTPCGAAVPLTRPTSNVCIGTADAQGNFGFWAAAGAYQYCIAATSFTTTCYNVILGSTLDGNNTFTGQNSINPFQHNNVIFVGTTAPYKYTTLETALAASECTTNGCRIVLVTGFRENVACTSSSVVIGNATGTPRYIVEAQPDVTLTATGAGGSIPCFIIKEGSGIQGASVGAVGSFPSRIEGLSIVDSRTGTVGPLIQSDITAGAGGQGSIQLRNLFINGCFAACTYTSPAAVVDIEQVLNQSIFENIKVCCASSATEFRLTGGPTREEGPIVLNNLWADCGLATGCQNLTIRSGVGSTSGSMLPVDVIGGNMTGPGPNQAAIIVDGSAVVSAQSIKGIRIHTFIDNSGGSSANSAIGIKIIDSYNVDVSGTVMLAQNNDTMVDISETAVNKTAGIHVGPINCTSPSNGCKPINNHISGYNPGAGISAPFYNYGTTDSGLAAQVYSSTFDGNKLLVGSTGPASAQLHVISNASITNGLEIDDTEASGKNIVFGPGTLTVGSVSLLDKSDSNTQLFSCVLATTGGCVIPQGGLSFVEQASDPPGIAGRALLSANSTTHTLRGNYNNGTTFSIPQVITGTSAAFATATTAGTCVQNTTAITGAATTMAVLVSPVSTPGVGAQWSAFVSSAGNITINECAVATSAGGTIAFNIRVFP